MKYIYCHPLFDERKCGHRFAYKLSESLKAKNIEELARFDYDGTGEAEGNFSDITIQSLIKDTENTTGTDLNCIIGTRFGASIACMASCNKKINKLILIEPVIDGNEYVEFLFRKQRLKDKLTGSINNLADNGFVNLEGYKTSEKFIEQLKNFSLLDIAEKINTENLLLIKINQNKDFDNKFTQILEDRNINITLKYLKFPQFWERIPITDYSTITDSITEWCVD